MFIQFNQVSLANCHEFSLSFPSCVVCSRTFILNCVPIVSVFPSCF